MSSLMSDAKQRCSRACRRLMISNVGLLVEQINLDADLKEMYYFIATRNIAFRRHPPFDEQQHVYNIRLMYRRCEPRSKKFVPYTGDMIVRQTKGFRDDKDEKGGGGAG